VARRLIGKRSYKSDERIRQTKDREVARRDIVWGLRSSGMMERHGFRVELSDEMGEGLVEDQMGDELDAVLCAVQAAWAWLQRDRGHGIPVESDGLEGWIVDPYVHIEP
jgi:hypothetical protein